MILSACYRQRGENAAALLLRQYVYKGVTVFLSCMCKGKGHGAAEAGAYMAGQLLRWFRMLDPDKLTGRQEKAVERLAHRLGGTVRRIDRELGNGRTDFAVFLCMGSRYVMFCRGEVQVCLINTAYGRTHMCRLFRGGDRREALETGSLQPDIGLLFVTEPFYEYIPDAVIKGSLNLCGGETEDRMYRRLKELVQEGARRGCTGICAVYLRTVSG